MEDLLPILCSFVPNGVGAVTPIRKQILPTFERDDFIQNIVTFFLSRQNLISEERAEFFRSIISLPEAEKLREAIRHNREAVSTLLFATNSRTYGVTQGRVCVLFFRNFHEKKNY